MSKERCCVHEDVVCHCKASVKATAGRRSVEKRTWAKQAAFSAETSSSAEKKA
jgi:hypothetical protein